MGDFVWYAYQPNGGTVQNCLRLSYGYAYRGDDYICENQYATICQLFIWINSYVEVMQYLNELFLVFQQVSKDKKITK